MQFFVDLFFDFYACIHKLLTFFSRSIVYISLNILSQVSKTQDKGILP